MKAGKSLARALLCPATVLLTGCDLEAVAPTLIWALDNAFTNILAHVLSLFW